MAQSKTFLTLIILPLASTTWPQSTFYNLCPLLLTVLINNIKKLEMPGIEPAGGGGGVLGGEAARILFLGTV